MRTIEEMQSELRAMALELEQLKQTKESDNLTADFRQISANASRYPIKPHPLEGFDEHAKKCYVTLLLTVARFESDTLSDNLLLAHRIAFGMEYLHKGEELQEEFNTAQTLTFAQLDEITALFKDNDERLMLILECLLTAGVFASGRQEAMEYIAQLAVLLNVGKEELVFLSNMAAVILTGDPAQYKCKIYNEYGKMFDCYLSSIIPAMEIIYAKRLPILSSKYSWQKVTIKNTSANSILIENKFIGSFVDDLIENTTIKVKCEKLILLYKFDFSRHSSEHDNKPIGVSYHYLNGRKIDILDFWVDNGGRIYLDYVYGYSECSGVKYCGDTYMTKNEHEMPLIPEVAEFLSNGGTKS